MSSSYEIDTEDTGINEEISQLTVEIDLLKDELAKKNKLLKLKQVSVLVFI